MSKPERLFAVYYTAHGDGDVISMREAQEYLDSAKDLEPEQINYRLYELTPIRVEEREITTRKKVIV